ncbi:hypothetical protein V8D89_001080 [Ganoderma adspersum]
MSSHRTSFKPLELAPEWLTESPITFDDLRCTTYPPTLWRVSLPPSPAAPRNRTSTRKSQHRRNSVASVSSSSSSSSASSDEIEELSKAGSPQCHPAPLRVSTHLAPEDASSFLFYHDDDDERDGLHVGRWGPEREREDDEATLNEQGPGPDLLIVEEEDPSPIDPFFKPKPQPHSLSASPQPLTSLPLDPEQARELERAPSADSSQYVHSRGSSFDCTSPWFMHVSAGALAALDDQLLQSPVDAFADLCYARAVQLPDAAPVPYSWRRFSRLRPLSPFSDIHEADEEEGEGEGSSSGSDTDGDDEVVSPSDALDWMAQGARPRIYSPTPHAHRDAHPPAHPRHYAQESDGSIQFRSQIQTLSPTAFLSTPASKPLPLIPPPTPSPPPSFSAERSPYNLVPLRGAAASPLPSFLPSPAVSQAQLALLFGTQTPPKPNESIHFFPSAGTGVPAVKGSWSRRGVQALRITTNTNTRSNASNNGGSGGSTPATATTDKNAGGWFQRGLRAIRA